MTRKLTLDLDALTVKSFETQEKPVETRGTVQAHGKAACPDSYIGSCNFTIRTCASVEFSCREDG